MLPKRYVGRSGLEISLMGLGCRAIGGSPWRKDGGSLSWGRVDDVESHDN